MNRTTPLWVAVAILLVLQLASWVGGSDSGTEGTARLDAGGEAFDARLARIEERLAGLELVEETMRRGRAASADDDRGEPSRLVPPDPSASGPSTWVEAAADLEERLSRLEAETIAAGAGASDPLLVRSLTDAIARGDLDEVQRLLAAGVDLDGRDDDRRTPLAAAAIAGEAHLVDLLLAGGAGLERKSGRRSMTPLLAALDAVQEDIALHLLELGSDPRAVDKNGESALIWASHNGADRVVRQLLARDVEVDFQSHWGGTALSDAAREGHLDIARLLLDHGADPNLADDNGNTPLGFAQDEGHEALIALLLAYGAH